MESFILTSYRNYESNKPGTSLVPSVGPWINPTDPSLNVSPMYKQLDTNIPNRIMEYKDFPFPEDAAMFPSRSTVLEYVQSYSNTFLKDKREIIFSLQTLVEDVRKDKISNKWIVSTRNNISNENEKHSFDAVIICSGHYSVSYIPEVEGLKEWAEKDPLSISHAKYFDNPEPFKDKNVLIIGNAASGADISTQLIATAKLPIYRSVNTFSSSQPITNSIKEVSKVIKYDHDTKSALLENGDTISNIDHILFCTGYLYSIPYLKSYITGDDAIITTGTRLRRLYKQMFYIPDPTLIAVGMQWKIIPMPMAESQGAVIARVLAGRLKLPNKADMLIDEENETRINGDDRQFHCYQFPKDYEYTRELYKWIKGAETHKSGFVAEVWDKEKQSLRSNSGEIKNEYFKQAILKAEKNRL